jgi:hypothetical protein
VAGGDVEQAHSVRARAAIPEHRLLDDLPLNGLADRDMLDLQFCQRARRALVCRPDGFLADFFGVGLATTAAAPSCRPCQ